MVSFTWIPKPIAKEDESKLTGHGLDYNSHFLIGLRKDTRSAVLIAGWNRLPTQEEIKRATASLAYPYTQFALLNATNIWDAEPSTAP